MFIIEHCDNVYIIDMMKKVFDKNTRIIISSKQNQAHIDEASKEHIEILNALIAQNYDNAASLMRTHISNCRQDAVNFFYSI
jgi:DNA-binding GntR family transcriptional regulator